jgi:hypothetical protein
LSAELPSSLRGFPTLSRLVATIILRSFIPLFRITYFPLQLFGVKMRFIESLAGWVWHFFITHHGCLWPSRAIVEPITAVASDTLNSESVMKLLNFLVESFVGAFGITKPKPEQQRTVALALGGFLLLFFVVLASLILWMLFGVRR